MEKLKQKLDELIAQGYSRESAITILNDEITALARAEYMTMCVISSLSPEELEQLETKRHTSVSRWLENI